MITPDDIIKRAGRKYHEVLRGWLAGEDFVAIEFPVGALSKNLDQRRQQIEHLREHSSEAARIGYALEWETVNMQALGKQTIPRRIIISSLDDYLALLRKRPEFEHFVADVKKIRQKFPTLESWMQSNIRHIIEYHGRWDDLLAVCDYFVKNPHPNVYIRELPIPVHTKFIEANSRILSELLETLLPAASVHREAADFNQRFGLKNKPSIVRLRLLEEQLDWRYGIRVDDLSLPVDQLAHLLADHLRPRHVIIVENLINLLTLPRIANGVGLLGSGFAVHLLRDVTWLNGCDVIYWGDIDAHGFQILSELRGIFPHTRSVMMDRETFDRHRCYVVQGKPIRAANFASLTEAEALLAGEIVSQDLRLEQEHIPQAYAELRLKQLLMS